MVTKKTDHLFDAKLWDLHPFMSRCTVCNHLIYSEINDAVYITKSAFLKISKSAYLNKRI